MHDTESVLGIVEVHVRVKDLRAEAMRGGLNLSEMDRVRIAAMPEGPRRAQFLAGRHLIRDVLGIDALRRLAAEPGERPVIRDGPPISLSHCPSHIALAVAPAGPVGVDIERGDRAVDVAEITETCLTEQESLLLGGLDAKGRRRRFLALWTRKEAVLKAMGTGLRTSPKLIETIGDDGLACEIVRGFRIITIDDGDGSWILSVAVPAHAQGADAIRVHTQTPSTASDGRE